MTGVQTCALPILSSGEVLSLVAGLQGRSILALDLEEWRRRLLDSPWVADASLRRTLPSTVDVMILERTPLGIGRNAVLDRVIVDKNARIGDGAQLVNAAGVQQADGNGYYIRDGVVIVPKDGVIQPGTRV